MGILAAIPTLEAWVERACDQLAEAEGDTKVAEWVLDNSHQIVRAIRQVARDLPESYSQRLPPAAGADPGGPPRIYEFARQVAARSTLQLDLATLLLFVDVHQETETFAIGELWALPTMLRILCLEVVVDVLARALPRIPPPLPGLQEPLLRDLDDAERVGRAIRAMSVVSAISWRDFVDRTSVIESVLAKDPTGTYPHMDFETRDRYRRAVEELSEHSELSEPEVATAAVTRARSACTDVPGEPGDTGTGVPPEPPRGASVGYWLIAEGRARLEAEIGARTATPIRLRRRLSRHAVALYLAGIASATAAALALPIAAVVASHAGPGTLLVAALVTALPACALATSLVQWLVTRIVRPRVLPKMQFDDGIPEQWRTAVVVPTLLDSADAVAALLANLERHHLANPDPQLVFVLLTDFPDAIAATMPGDDALLEQAMAGVRALNARYNVERGTVFHLAHRERLYNAADDCWMGWERKRGKLEEWNRLLRGGSTSYVRQEGDPASLTGIRFVITLDSDTMLPRGAAAKLVGTLAHPLNRPRFDERTGRTAAGYSILQPRIGILPAAGGRSWFARLFSGDTAIDIYSRAVSDVYQDLFGIGIYVGKGIYDVDAFTRALAGRVPENALASHDLFEGLHARAALASDILLYEEFPSHYLAFVRRMHRWVRGDWQLLAWLSRSVPDASGKRVPSRFTALERWQILDNHRRSLLAPALLAMLLAGWLLLPGNPLFWTLLVMGGIDAHCGLDLVLGMIPDRPWKRGTSLAARPGSEAATRLARILLVLVFLPFEAWVVLDAVLRTFTRLLVTRKNLLQWQTAARAASSIAGDTRRSVMWRAMAAAPALALLVAAAVFCLRPAAALVALPFLVAWLVSPEVAYRISLPAQRRRQPLTHAQHLFVRRLARRTWLFFETFVGPQDHWLPPDNYQEVPTGRVDHRTSPTNVGMLLTSTMAAWDLGYIGAREMASRLRGTLETLGRLERYRGHLLNWYDTRTLEPLQPRYVSTVDSGNLVASQLAVSRGCIETAAAPVLSAARWDGLMDALSWLEEALTRLVPEAEQPRGLSLAARAAAIRRHAGLARGDPGIWCHTLTDLCTNACADLDKLLMETIEAHRAPLNLPALHDLRSWLDRVHRHLRAMQEDLETLLAWLPVLEKAQSLPAPGGSVATAVAERVLVLLPPTIPLQDITEQAARARQLVAEQATGGRPHAGCDPAWLAELDAALAGAAEQAAAVTAQFAELAAASEASALATDFRFLYDRERNLFRIGYNVGAETLDAHYYDLLASECRIASLLAIAKGDVPPAHWFHLGRPMTRAAGELTLLSWGGTMFEYLMPRLLLRGGEGELLGLSEHAAIDAQRAYGRQHHVPWGISESGFSAMDPEHNYQYHAFGVPGLGLRRDLGKDLVVAPYATALALPLQPQASAENLLELARFGGVGEFGLHEAIDFTPSRLVHGSKYSVVRSYMAHHQGMAFAALANHLCDFPLVRRLHDHPLLQTAELLLHERVPAGVQLELPRVTAAEERRAVAPPRALLSWAPVQYGAFPELHAVGNGRLTTVFSDSGAGGIHWAGRALTRWNPDATVDDSGLWTYVRDLDDGRMWSVGRQPTGVQASSSEIVFHPHMAELRRRDGDIAIKFEVGVAAGDDVEIRRVTVVNEGDRPRRLAFVSYAEVVLAPPEQDLQHPAFSKLFVHAEELPALDAVIFERRPRSQVEHPPVLLHRLIAGSDGVRMTGSETSRERFLGRGGNARAPQLGRHLVVPCGERRGESGLDAIMSIQASVELQPGATERFAFLTMVAGSRVSVIELAQRYASPAALEWVLDDAASEQTREAARLDIEPALLPSFQRLLSLLLQQHSALRCDPARIAANSLSQNDLWRMGISGDVPILLLRIADVADTVMLEHLLRANRLWHRRGIATDLVVMHTGPSGYEDSLADEVHASLERLGALGILRRRGGLHLIRSDQIRPEDAVLLSAVAHVEIDSSRSLEAQLADAHRQRDGLPLFTPTDPTPPPWAPVPLERPRDLLFDNDIGGFAAEGARYVIPLRAGQTTPAPWANVIANADFGTVVTESGGGYTWSGNASERRLSVWRNDPVTDAPSEALYLRDEETGAVWMPMSPSQDAAIEVCHQAGRSTWRRCDHGLEQNVEVFVADGEPVKIIALHLRDLTGRPRRITATYYVEWVLGDHRSRCAMLLVPEYEPSVCALLARNPWNPAYAARVAFLVCDRKPHGYTTDRCEFLGREGDLRHPAALLRWGLSEAAQAGRDPCAALQTHIEIAPNGDVRTHFALGDGRDRDHALDLAQRMRDPDAVDRASAAVRERWQQMLGAIAIQTPDSALDVLVNHWLLYQTASSRLLGRTGFYQSSGAFGFRDQLQDVLALVHVAPGAARAQILECARHQFREGDVLHWWHPPEGRGVRTRCSDDLLWLPFVTAQYVEATGDTAVLDERVPFLVAPPLAPGEEDRYALFEVGTEENTLFEHCSRALGRGMTAGVHGLPLMGAGDWNDGMNRVGHRGRGESVWLAWFAIATARAFAGLCTLRDAHDLATAWTERASALGAAAESAGWDGAWYRRAYDDEGHPWGSAANEECRIDSIAQSWATLSGAADPRHAQLALDAAERELVREADGVARLLWPPFDKTTREVGYIRSYPPGVRENGGQYSHAAAWLALALARAGRGQAALGVLNLLNPIEHSRSGEAAVRYRVEPYVVAADIYAAPPYVGRGGWTWYTGSAAWTYRAVVEGLLGLKLSQGRLRIAPCLPPSWPGFRVALRLPGHGLTEIDVENTDGSGCGKPELIVDGRLIDGDTVELAPDGQLRKVHVRLGSAPRSQSAAG